MNGAGRRRWGLDSYSAASISLAIVVMLIPILSVAVGWAGGHVPEQLWQGWNVCIGGLIALNRRCGRRDQGGE